MRAKPVRYATCFATSVATLFFLGCAAPVDPPPAAPPDDNGPAVPPPSGDGDGTPGQPTRLSEVRFWAYQIGALNEDGAIDALAESAYDLLVLEPTRTDRENTDFDTAAMVARLKASDGSRPGFKKIVVAYIDIGEAEDWRTYWPESWVAPTAGGPGEPDFLLTVDPDGWSGNYPLAFWDERWKDIIINNDDSILQQVLDDGFDGIYMDWVEAYSDVDVMAAAEAAGLDPKAEMIEFIREIREHVREQDPNFFIIPQNASEIAFEIEEEYFAIIDAIGQEQIYFDGDADTEWDDPKAGDKSVPDEGADENDGYNRRFYEETLQPYLDAGIPVFSIDYARETANVAEAYSTASNNGYVPYVSLRPLDRLTETPPPDYASGSTDLPAGDLIIDGVIRTFGAETLNIRGNVIIQNGGQLTLNGTILNIISSFEEEFIIGITGSSRLQADNALIQGVNYQTAVVAEPEDGLSPTLIFNNTTVTVHAGIRPFGDTRITATNSNIEETQVHDDAVVSVTGGEGLYPVFFFDNMDAELNGLTDGVVTRTVDVPNGWSFSMQDAEVTGYQIDVENDSTVTLIDCLAITASMHTPGTLGGDEVVVENVTSLGPAGGRISGLGPEIIYENTAVDLFNIYLEDGDTVRIVGGGVNEANTLGSSQLTIENCTVEYNLVQASDESTLIIDNCGISADESTTPSLTAEANGRITVRDSDCAGLEAQAIDNGRIDFISCRNLDPNRLSVQGNGRIFIDGEPTGL